MLAQRLLKVRMMDGFRAIAVDYDGTLTSHERPSAEVLTELRSVRAHGMRVLLVTGRVLSELFGVFPEARDYFDAIVAENGAVVWHEAGGLRCLGSPVSRELEAALRARGLRTTRGEVLLGMDAAADQAALEEIGRLGLDYQLVRNREALMVLPSGISKGTGLSEALGELGISYHNTIGIGDAENDHALLEMCEIGVAVENAIPSLKAHADVVLSKPDGLGIAQFLRDALRGAWPRVAPIRWRVSIGARPDGSSVTLPASGINVLIVGASGSGKSYLAGLLAERLVRLGYSLCVFDPEGDHTSLGSLRGLVTLGGRDGMPSIDQLGRLLKGRFGGEIIDLSLLQPEERATYTALALEYLQQRRLLTGSPHWIFLDEAHASLGVEALRVDAVHLATKGFCLVTYHPNELCHEALTETDVLFFLPESELLGREFLSSHAGGGFLGIEPIVSMTRALKRGEALMLTLGPNPRAEVVVLGARRSTHVRHWHKYVHGYLAPRLHFHFRDASGPTGRKAANLEDFHRELQLCPASVLTHHLSQGDFSRWISQAIQDRHLASTVRAVEARSARTPDMETIRDALLTAIDLRYGDIDEATPTPGYLGVQG